ncbi:serine/threonine protein kinase [Seohaeicola zhoushanensis]|uniref:Serine/threonine protein kinase n=1 Tax=Seohaeicola zhoushanensis TaxID=1569283 RepID=A0A8J3GTZ4_9RHOB|nr:serine/threonine protein kinase [Seohaeicola zhoushanensis]GHF34903.1 serine/threonine protein kinase [Seohaeicola zhoushanensis]
MVESRPGDAFQPGELLNNTYRIEALLGRGGTSDVYKARSEISGRLMALKVLKSEFTGNDDYLVLLTREEEIRDIRHDAVVRYSECSRTQSGQVYLLMDYVEGPGLDKRLKQGPMPADELLTVARRVTEGLNAAHKRNIVHRDLSPDNIILKGGDPAQAVIIDFGIAKDTNPGAETIVGNEFAGKYAYAAPEQLSGQTDPRTDIYSLGALLLANFRGRPPDVGRNPMEVVQKKSEPLDTSGVPEPLKALLDKMTAPDPNDRFQSAAEVLAFLDNPSTGADSDATVVVPVARARNETATVPPARRTEPPKEPAKPAPPEPPTRKKSGAGLIVGLLLLLVAAAGGGAWFTGALDGVIGDNRPLADPYTLLIARPEGGAPSAVGNVPNEAMMQALTKLMQERAGQAQLTLARGDIAGTWADDVLETIKQIDDLPEWRLTISGNRGHVTGKTTDEAVHKRLMAALGNDLPGALDGNADIAYQPLFLPVSEVTGVLAKLADCGPLETPGAPNVGYGPDSKITVTGRVAGTATRVKLFDGLSAVANGRQVVLDVEVLNETLCLIESHLPKAPSSGIDIAFTVGDRNEPNPSGRFFVGENPVIDVVLPADVTDGYLTVSVIDVSGNVLHMLPILSQLDNSVTALRDGRTGQVRVRVAFPLSEAAGTGKLAFRVDDSTLGKSKVIAIHSTAPLFEGQLPSSESAKSYAEALQKFATQNEAVIQSIDSRILTTAKP